MTDRAERDERLRRDLERRRSTRVDVDRAIPVRIGEDGDDESARLVNIGVDGARLDFPRGLPAGTTLRLRIPVATGAPIEIAGAVVWSLAEAQDGGWPAGVAFRGLTEPERARLIDAILGMR
ncbi:MAG: PilZ domain-containing protein [Planctomycetota bacterium]